MPTVNQVAEALSHAHEAVEKASLPKDLENAAFRESAILFFRALESGGQDANAEEVKRAKSLGREDNPLSQLATKLNIDLESVSEVFGFEGEDPQVILSPSKLSKTAVAATVQVSLLICAVRQGTGMEDMTELSVIREAVKHAGVLDDSNFSSHMNKFASDMKVSGAKQSRKFGMNRRSWEHASELIKTLAGPAS